MKGSVFISESMATTIKLINQISVNDKRIIESNHLDPKTCTTNSFSAFHSKRTRKKVWKFNELIVVCILLDHILHAIQCAIESRKQADLYILFSGSSGVVRGFHICLLFAGWFMPNEYSWQLPNNRLRNKNCPNLPSNIWQMRHDLQNTLTYL